MARAMHSTRMLRFLCVFLAGIVQMATLVLGVDNPATLEIRVVDGEGAAYTVGSRATRGVTVLVSDESGRPVQGATVSFSLPAAGPGGVFVSGSRTEIATTRADGRAAAWGMQWNRTAGPFEFRITASTGQARAAIVSAQYLTNLPEGTAAASPKARGGTGSHKLLWISLAVAGAAVAGVAGVASVKSATPAAAAPVSPTQIGTPTISLGRP